MKISENNMNLSKNCLGIDMVRTDGQDLTKIEVIKYEISYFSNN